MRCFRSASNWIVGLLLALGLSHFLGTGSPIPLWHIEDLQNPGNVAVAAEEHLLLEDGRKLKLPHIHRIPHRAPLFRAAIQEGVEVSPDGEVTGLLWLRRYCGNDPYYWRRVRVNLTDLAGALDPDGIDPSLVPPDVVSFLLERDQIDEKAARSASLNQFDLSKMRRIRAQIEHSLKHAGQTE